MEKKSASQKLRVPTALVTERRRAAAQRRGVEKKWPAWAKTSVQMPAGQGGLLLRVLFLLSCALTTARRVRAGRTERGILEDIQELLGTERSQVINSRTPFMEEELSHTFEALPKSGNHVGAAVANHALHRLFLQVHSWQMKGLQPVAGAWHEHSPTIALKRAPAKLRNVFDKKLQQRGLNLNELSVLAATIEELVRNEADVLLNASCRARKPSQNATESKCCQSRSRGPCREVSYQAAGFSGQGGQGLEASAAQEVMEYYMSSYILGTESSGELTGLPGGQERPGALDESDQEARVIVPNYMMADSNCLASSEYYSVCCKDPCEEIMDQLEASLRAPSASPSAVLSAVQALPEAKAQGLSLEGELLERHRALRSCESFAKICAARLSEVASHHGEAQLQMRDRDLWPMAKPHTLGGPVARQWLHHAFPRDCPFPHVSGTVRQSLAQFQEERHERAAFAEYNEMQEIVNLTLDANYEPALAQPPGSATQEANAAAAADPETDAEVWVLAEPVSGHRIGEEVSVPAGAPSLDKRALIRLQGSDGKERIVMAAQVEFDDFPLEPRTCHEYLKAISDVAESCYAQHLSWVQQSRIPEGDRAIFEDEILSQVLDLAIRYDSLNVVNLASFEMIVRRKQLLAEARVGNPNAPSYEAADYFMGRRYRPGGGIVVPSLTEHGGPDYFHLRLLLVAGTVTMRDRDLLPLPLLEVSVLHPEKRLSRATMRRIQKRKHVQSSVNEAIISLNLLFSGGFDPMPLGSVATLEQLPQGQKAAVTHIIRSVKAGGSPPASATYAGALEVLRVSCSPYGLDAVGVGDVVPMKLDCLSLPESNVSGVSIANLLKGQAGLFLQEPEKYMLQDAGKWGVMSDEVHKIRTYNDPKLKSKEFYLSFLGAHLF
eukprot:s3068_g8.t1